MLVTTFLLVLPRVRRRQQLVDAREAASNTMAGHLADSIANAEAVRAKMMAGSFDIFVGELKDNTGKVVIPKGKAFKQTDAELEGMNYLIEGVIGKV